MGTVCKNKLFLKQKFIPSCIILYHLMSNKKVLIHGCIFISKYSCMKIFAFVKYEYLLPFVWPRKLEYLWLLKELTLRNIIWANFFLVGNPSSTFVVCRVSCVCVCGVPWMDAMLRSVREQRQLYSHNQHVQYMCTHSRGHNIDMNRAGILAWALALHGHSKFLSQVFQVGFLSSAYVVSPGPTSRNSFFLFFFSVILYPIF